MSWSALLLSITGYCWYLVFAHLTHATHPGLWTGLAGLLLLAVLPACLAYGLNRGLLASGPTVLRLALVNLLVYLLYTLLTVTASVTSVDFLFWQPPGPLHWTAYLFPSGWLLLNWLGGTYFVFQTVGAKTAARPTGLKTVEASLVLMPPAFLLLTFMDFSGPLLVVLLTGWFLTLALALAVEGPGVASDSVIRYDIVFFHALVPPLVAAILLAAAFFGDVRTWLQAARGTLLTLLGYLVQWLSMFFSPPPPSTTPLPGMPNPPVPTGAPETVHQPSTWFYLLFVVMGLLLIMALLTVLPKLLKIRLGPLPRIPGHRYAPLRALLQVWQWLAALLRGLLKFWVGPARRLKALAQGLGQKAKTILDRWLPARTPGQKIFRSYQAFLRLGRRCGCPRQVHETPLEYARRLQVTSGRQQFPSVEVNRLTGLFLETAYSNRPPSWQQADESERLLKTIVRRLHAN